VRFTLSLFNSHSGRIDPAELAVILRSLGYSKLKFKSATFLAEQIGANIDEHGILELSENRFVKSMITGEIGKVLGSMNITKSVSFRRRSFSGKSLQTKNSQNGAKLQRNRSMKLMNQDALVKWTLKKF
jgi:hypothetical protein